MKRIALIAATLALTCVAFAQDNEIRRIPGVGSDSNQISLSTLESGFWMGAELLGGSTLNLKTHNMGFTEADVVAGYRFNQYIKVGAGIGFRYYINQGCLRRPDIKWGFPLFVTARGNIIGSTYRRVVPYWGVEAGGTIQDGLFFRPTIGLRVGEIRHAFTVGLSYMCQNITQHKVVEDYTTKTYKYMSFLSLRLGYEF